MLSRDLVTDSDFMQMCLRLALQAEGRTAPNPVVGAVVVDKQGAVVGEGFHARAGQPHAEVIALQAAGSRAHGATLYVNLEPCCHFGRTGPCAQEVLKFGIDRVVVGMKDPNPKVAGGGISLLRANGVQVDVGVLQEESVWANRAFISSIKRGRPWVCLKMAATLDGKIADRNGRSKWISGERAQQHVHTLRNRFDCILVGADTARLDDPELTVRQIEGGRNPHRAVVDTGVSISPGARMFSNFGDASRTFLFCSNGSDVVSRIKALPETVSVFRVAMTDSGHLDLSDVFKALHSQEINSVLCEGGGRFAAALLADDLVDEVHWILAPKFLNDVAGRSVLGNSYEKSLQDVLQLERVRVCQLDKDVLIQGTVGKREFLDD